MCSGKKQLTYNDNYPFGHFVSIRVSMMIIQYENSADHAAGNHEHYTVEICTWKEKKKRKWVDFEEILFEWKLFYFMIFDSKTKKNGCDVRIRSNGSDIEIMKILRHYGTGWINFSFTLDQIINFYRISQEVN